MSHSDTLNKMSRGKETFYLYDVGDEVGQSLVHFDFLCVFLDLVFHGLQLVSDTQNLTLHDLQS